MDKRLPPMSFASRTAQSLMDMVMLEHYEILIYSWSIWLSQKLQKLNIQAFKFLMSPIKT